MIFGIWRQQKGALERVVIESPMRYEEELRLGDGDWIEIEAHSDSDFERKKKEREKRAQTVWQN